MNVDMVFYLNVALFLTHEIDAVDKHEWRLLPVISRLPDRTGFTWFVILHVPLFVPIIWLAHNSTFQACFSAILIFHALAHWSLRNHPKFEFDGLSNLFVYPPAILALIGLLLGWYPVS